MRKLWLCIIVLLLFSVAASALQRQPDADYKARREALGKKVGGIVVLFGSLEPVESLYSFRQDDDFYYLSGWAEPGAALLIAPAAEAGDKNPARPYTEILFLPPRNARMERFTGPKLGADDPQAPKLSGFDHVEEMSQLPQELSKLITGRSAHRLHRTARARRNLAHLRASGISETHCRFFNLPGCEAFYRRSTCSQRRR